MKHVLLFAVTVMLSLGKAVAGEPQRITRADCRLSFSVPAELSYIEVAGAQVSNDELCYIAFDYASSAGNKHSQNLPPIPDDWRTQVDFWVTIKKVPLDKQIEAIESAGGGSQGGIFSLDSKVRANPVRGDGYVFTYSYVKPTASMLQLKQSREVVFAVGDRWHSAVYYLYPVGADSKQRTELSVLKRLFSSFAFDTAG
ncbi:hypothetical protein [Caballeronia sp. AZ10_KS36]|uniref:hypothetical protein n=1 Tax=Caballeronia sp. AZ10_KS36 TaxID=2921757 RepID=UPI0020289A74|nr:hypothetical protein [Caballeronia sp. AZ10_KS36]